MKHWSDKWQAAWMRKQNERMESIGARQRFPVTTPDIERFLRRL